MGSHGITLPPLEGGPDLSKAPNMEWGAWRYYRERPDEAPAFSSKAEYHAAIDRQTPNGNRYFDHSAAYRGYLSARFERNTNLR